MVSKFSPEMTEQVDTLDSVIERWPVHYKYTDMPKRNYRFSSGTGMVYFAHKGFESHMSSEGWQLGAGLQRVGCKLLGPGFEHSDVDVKAALEREQPAVAIIEDKREWDRKSGSSFSRVPEFENFDSLNTHGVYVATVHKDLHHSPPFHHRFHKDINPDAIICYYHERLARHCCRWLHAGIDTVRIYHSLDVDEVPPFSADRENRWVVSGAVTSHVYPLRHRAFRMANKYNGVGLKFPGYHARGWATPRYLKDIARFKVHLATASVFGFALRKIIESVACGCTCVTTLPSDDVLPMIDEALVRVPPFMPPMELQALLNEQIEKWDPDRANYFASRAKTYYDYRTAGERLFQQLMRNRTRSKAL